MSQQNIYSIQLLNDLHNHFPEILYNPGRFQNVQQILAYIRSVADVSPYNIGQQMYNRQAPTPQPPQQNYRQNATNVPSYRSPVSTPSVAAPPVPTPVAAPSVPTPTDGMYTTLPVNTTVPQAFVTTLFEENIPTTRVRMPVNTNTSVLMNTLLGGLFGDIMGTSTGGINLNNFLNERVQVYPTSEEIENASITTRATARQDDICAICQDEIDTNQNIRRLTHCNHYFHRECIDTWFRSNVHCPTCRHDIREVDNNQQNVRNNHANNSNMPPPVPENHRRMNIRRPEP